MHYSLTTITRKNCLKSPTLQNLLPKLKVLDICLRTQMQPIYRGDNSSLSIVVRNLSSYYILPALWGKGGGLSIASTSNELSCPLSVVQTPSELFNGLPIKISSPHKTVELETNYILEFTVDEPPSCAETPAKLTVVSGDVTQTVKLAGHGNTVSGWFKVQALNGAWMKKGAWIYKIEFCPTVGDACADIGISHDDKGNRVLAITHNETPFMVVFSKAE